MTASTFPKIVAAVAAAVAFALAGVASATSSPPAPLRAVLAAGGYTLAEQTSTASGYISSRRAGDVLLIRLAIDARTHGRALVSAGTLRTDIGTRRKLERQLNAESGYHRRSTVTRVRTFGRYVVVDVRAIL